jgi:methionyl-tRNA formyltransferase
MSNTAILLGSKPAACVALLLLVQKGWKVTEVVASESQAEWIARPGLSDLAKKLGIRTVSSQDELSSRDVDFVISYMCRDRVKSPCRTRGKYAINFHAGPLPEYGGWAFYNLAILEDAKEYGCTCHIMDEGFDTGPIVKVRRFEINAQNETALSLERKTQTEMLFLFSEVLAAYERQGFIQAFEQDPSRMRYLTRKEFTKMKEIPPNSPPEVVDRIARAFWYPPYDLAYYSLPDGGKIEAVPSIAKYEISSRLHKLDLIALLYAVGLDQAVDSDFVS